MGSLHPELAELIHRRDEAFGLWRSVLADGAADGSLRKVDPFQTLWIISSAITGMVDQRYVASDEHHGSPPTGTLVDILLGGLATAVPGDRFPKGRAQPPVVQMRSSPGTQGAGSITVPNQLRADDWG